MLVNGHNIFLEDYGPKNGSAVVLLHHGLGSLRAWREQIPAITSAGFHVIAYDRWGYGRSDARPELDLPTFASDIEDLLILLDQMKILQVTLVGHSDGGTMVLYFAAQYPNLMTCLVTVAAHIYLEPKMEPGILGVKQAFENDEAFRTGMQHTQGEKYQEVFHNWFNGWHREEYLSWDLRPLLGRIKCPVLVVQGEEDEHATPRHATDIANAISDAELYLMPGARHMLPQENANLFNQRLLQFLGKHAADAQPSAGS